MCVGYPIMIILILIIRPAAFTLFFTLALTGYVVLCEKDDITIGQFNRQFQPMVAWHPPYDPYILFIYYL